LLFLLIDKYRKLIEVIELIMVRVLIYWQNWYINHSLLPISLHYVHFEDDIHISDPSLSDYCFTHTRSYM